MTEGLIIIAAVFVLGVCIGFFYGRALMAYQLEKDGYAIEHDQSKPLGRGRYRVKAR